MTDRLVHAVFAGRALTEPMIIDAHAHLGAYARFFIPTPDARSMVHVMDRCGIKQAILSSHLAIAQDAATGNEVTARATERFPGRLLGYIVANPHQRHERELKTWRDHPAMVGVKLHPDLHEYPLDGPAYSGVWEFAEECGRPVLTHTWGGSPYSSAEMVGEVAAKYPGVRIIAGHAGALREAFPAMIQAAQRFPNLHLEICGSNMTSYWVARMVRSLGPGRVLYGSDFPFIDMRYSIGRVIFSELSYEEKLDVLGGAMARLLGRPALDRKAMR